NNRGNLRLAQQQQAEAEADYERARKLFEKLVADYPLPANAPPVPRGGPQGEEQTRAEYLQEPARTYRNLGAVWTAAGATKTAEAEKAYTQAAKMWTTLTTRYPDVPEYRKDLAATYLNRGTLRYVTGKGNEALADYQEATKRLSELAGQFRSVPD